MTGLSVKRQVLTDKLFKIQLIRKIPHFYGQVMTDVKKRRRSRSSNMFILSHPPTSRATLRETPRTTLRATLRATLTPESAEGAVSSSSKTDGCGVKLTDLKSRMLERTRYTDAIHGQDTGTRYTDAYAFWNNLNIIHPSKSLSIKRLHQTLKARLP